MHYSIIVTGIDIEEQMMPFIERGAIGGEESEYVIRCEDSPLDIDELKKKFQEYLERKPYIHTSLDFSKSIVDENGFPTYASREEPEEKVKTFQEYLRLWNDLGWYAEAPPLNVYSKDITYGYFLTDNGKEDGEVTQVFERSYPNQKWDWFVIGGRWENFFLVKGRHQSKDIYNPKSYGMANTVIKSHVNRDYIKAHYKKLAELQWDLYRELRAERFENDLRAAIDKHDERLLKFLKSTPAYRYLQECGIRFDWFSSTPRGFKKHEYVSHMEGWSGVSYGFLHQGVWKDKDDVGFWNDPRYQSDSPEVRAAAKSEREISWTKTFNSWWNSLPADTLLTIVDIHC